MKIFINNEEHITVYCNHLKGDPTKHHALTISNYGGFLNCREFNRPEEKKESSATDNQQLKAEILPIVDRALLDIIDGNYDKAILSLNMLTAKLSAV